MKSIILLLIILPFLAKAQSGTITTIAGTGTAGFSGDGGAATAAKVYYPWSAVADGGGNIYIGDYYNNRIRKINSGGIITTIAGTGAPGYNGDGGPATAAKLYFPAAVVAGPGGTIYIADNSNNRIRKISASGVISTVAGTGTSGYSGDGGPATAAKIAQVYGIKPDRNGNLFIADHGNHRIRKIDLSGTITTVAGTGSAGYSGDGGPATAAQLNNPQGVDFDGYGNMYICDYYNHRVRKVTTAGIITTIAGNGSAAFSGDGGAATAAALNSPFGIAVELTGAVYIADSYNQRVRRVSPAGVITTVAGTGTAAFSGDGGPSSAAALNNPHNIGTDVYGNLFIADHSNYRVRKIAGTNRLPVYTASGTQSLSICENAAAFNLNSLLNVTDADAGQAMLWAVTTAPLHGNISQAFFAGTTTGTNVSPTGFTYTPATGFSGRDTIKIHVYDGFARDSAVFYITVMPLPDAGTLSGPGTVCTGAAIALTPTVSGGVWSTTNATATVSTSGIVTGVMAGTDTIRYTLSNTCGVNVATKVVTINISADPGLLSGPAGVCMGSTITVTSTVSGGVWRVSDTTVATITAGGVVTPVAPGTDTVFYTVSNACGPSAGKKTIAVNIYPDAGTVTGADSLCEGRTDTLTITIPGGTWVAANTNASVTGNVVTGLHGGSVALWYLAANSCATDTAIHVLYVKPLPHPAAVSGPATVCVGQVITLSDSIAGGSWSVVNNTANIVSPGVIIGISPGVDTIFYSLINGCGTAYATHVVTVLALPFAGVITGDSVICLDSTLTLTATVPGGTWRLAASQLTLNTTATGSTIRGAIAGYDTVLYIVTNTCGADTALLPVRTDSCNPPPIIIRPGIVHMYPSPTRDILAIETPHAGDYDTYAIISATGAILQHGPLQSPRMELSLRALSSGLYFIKLTGGFGTWQEKIMKLQ